MKIDLFYGWQCTDCRIASDPVLMGKAYVIIALQQSQRLFHEVRDIIHHDYSLAQKKP
jgi:hypothetical protein